MQNLLTYLGAAAGVAVGISILACGGTGADGVGQDCTFDSDCPNGLLCNQNINQCQEECVDDIDCSSGTVCAPRPGGSQGSLCQEPDTMNNQMNNTNPNACMDNEDCAPDGVCMDGMCEFPSDTSPYQVIRLVDTTTDQRGCDGPNVSGDAGSDILAISLRNENGEVIGNAVVLDQQRGSGDLTRFNSGIFDGRPAGITRQNQCVSDFNEVEYAMGCGGTLMVRFLNNDQTPERLYEGDVIDVFEYGATCGGDPYDSYDVYLCTDTTAAVDNLNDSSCTVLLQSGGKGFTSVPVTLPQ